MHFMSMHELDRKSFRISEEPSPEFSMERMLQLLQQISIDLDHQTYCVLKAQRSQQKTVQHLQTLLEEMKRLQTKIEHRISTHLSATNMQRDSTNAPQVPTQNNEKIGFTSKLHSNFHHWMCWKGSPKIKDEVD